mmetsp:Transcript_4389/g.7822  ORF Transcript_4389/g.7822 Transcript_4389/m.7822 type:complete len:205 (-) Transcript_4389:184-798(-)
MEANICGERIAHMFGFRLWKILTVIVMAVNIMSWIVPPILNNLRNLELLCWLCVEVVMNQVYPSCNNTIIFVQTVKVERGGIHFEAISPSGSKVSMDTEAKHMSEIHVLYKRSKPRSRSFALRLLFLLPCGGTRPVPGMEDSKIRALLCGPFAPLLLEQPFFHILRKVWSLKDLLVTRRQNKLPHKNETATKRPMFVIRVASKH